MMTARFEKQDVKKAFLYLDVLVVGVFAISLIVLVRDAYIAGYWDARDSTLQARSFWAMTRDVAFVVASLSWIFFRFFREKMSALANPWA